MVKIAATITPSWQRAVERAYQDRKAGRTAERVACRTYRVASASGGAAHTVVIDSLVNLKATCDCMAGQRGLPCRHAAAALCEAARHIAAAERERATVPQAARLAADVDVYGDFPPAPAVEHKIGVAYNIHQPQADSADPNERLMARFCRS